MNLNLFLRPEDAKEEFDMKLAAQKAALQTELTMLGYKAIMQQGLKLHDAFTKVTAKKNVYNKMVFGAMAKHPFPIPNLMSAAAQAGVYNTGTTQPIIVMPTGMLELAKYTRPDSMKFSVSGFSQSDNKTIYMETPGVYYDDQLGVRIAIAKRHPRTEDYMESRLNGPALVRPELDDGYLHQKVNIDVLYKNTSGNPKLIPNPEKFGQWITLPDDSQMLVRHKCVMGSAILATEPGANSGEMLFAYPSTSVSTDTQSEMMKVCFFLLVRQRAKRGGGAALTLCESRAGPAPRVPRRRPLQARQVRGDGERLVRIASEGDRVPDYPDRPHLCPANAQQ